jgi:hypothetical protein
MRGKKVLGTGEIMRINCALDKMIKRNAPQVPVYKKSESKGSSSE